MNKGAAGIHRPVCPDGRTAGYIPCTQPCPERSRRYVLAATILASAIAFIDGSIVTIALPAMQLDLDTTFVALQWVVNGYALLLGGLILIGGSAGILFLLPFDLIERRNLSTTQVGLVLLPLGIIIGVLSRFAGDWSDKVGVRLPLALGSALVAVAAAGLSMGIDALWPGVIGPVVILSIGMALVVAPLSTAVMNATPDAQSGAASGVNNAASRLASLFAIVIVGAVASSAFAGQMIDASSARFGVLSDIADSQRGTLEAAFLHAYSVSMWVAAAWGLAATLIALWLLPKKAPA